MKKRHSSISSLSLPPQRFVMLLDSSLLSASFHGRKDTGKCRICQQCQDSLRKVHSFRICEGSVVCYCFMDARRKHKIPVIKDKDACQSSTCMMLTLVSHKPQVPQGLKGGVQVRTTYTLDFYHSQGIQNLGNLLLLQCLVGKPVLSLGEEITLLLTANTILRNELNKEYSWPFTFGIPKYNMQRCSESLAG